MSHFTKPYMWALSPLLTKEPDLWRYAKSIIPIWEGVPGENPESVYDIVNGQLTMRYDLASKHIYELGPGGIRINFNATYNNSPNHTGVSLPVGVLNGADKLIVFAQFYNLAGETSVIQEDVILSNWPGTNNQIITRYDSTANQFEFFVDTGSGTIGGGFNGTAGTSGFDTVVFIYTGSELQVWLNGEKSSTTYSVSGTLNTETSTNPKWWDYVGEPADSPRYEQMIGGLLVGIGDEHTAKRLSADPFMMLRPAGF